MIQRVVTGLVLVVVLFGVFGFALSEHVGMGHRCPVATEECATLQQGTGMALLHVTALRTMLQGLIPAGILLLAAGFSAVVASLVSMSGNSHSGHAFRMQRTPVERFVETVAAFHASQSLRRWLALRTAGMPRDAVWVYGSS